MMQESLFNQNNKLIPRSLLFGNPEKLMVRMSHDGKHISYIAPKNGVLNIWLSSFDDISNAQVITDDTDRGIRQYFWAYDNKHILFMQDHKGDENFRLYSYNIESKEIALLSPENGIKTVIFKISIDKPNEILIGLNQRKQEYFDVYKLDLDDCTTSLILENDKFSSVTADNNLNIRFGVLSNSEGNEEYYEYVDSEWKLRMVSPMADSKTTGIMGFDNTNHALYMLDSRDRDTAALTLWNLNTNTTNLIFEDKRADISVFAFHPTKKNIQVIVVDYDKPILQILDPEIESDISFLQKMHQGFFSIVSRATDDSVWLVAYSDDVMLPHYYVYNRLEQKLSFLFSAQPELEKYNLCKMEPIIIKSRDGLDLVSYLTMPKDISIQVPMVLYVHGGPWVRDVWSFNHVHQWLANRGYAVLSVNYRGSTGFGKNFVNQGNREWGAKMHDDLIDVVNWAIAHNIADPKKICIMGGSYGGYATLVGLTFTPEIFACGVDIVGPSNLITLLESFPAYWKPIMVDMKHRVGDHETEEGRQELKNRSPLTFVNKIVKPLFIAQGEHDPRVKKAESDQIVDAMKKHNIPVLYAVYPDEGHGFAKPDNRLSFYAMTEQFLHLVLGGLAEDIGSSLNGANFVLNDQKNLTNTEVEGLIYRNITK